MHSKLSNSVSEWYVVRKTARSCSWQVFPWFFERCKKKWQKNMFYIFTVLLKMFTNRDFQLNYQLHGAENISTGWFCLNATNFSYRKCFFHLINLIKKNVTRILYSFGLLWLTLVINLFVTHFRPKLNISNNLNNTARIGYHAVKTWCKKRKTKYLKTW